MFKLEISDTDGGRCLSFDLKDILHVLGDHGATLCWGIAEFEATGDLGSLGGHDDIDARIESGGGLWLIPWQDLWTLSHRVRQIINGTFVGFRSVDKPGKDDERCNWISRASIVVEAIDSSLWQVRTQRHDIVDLLQRHFRCTKLV